MNSKRKKQSLITTISYPRAVTVMNGDIYIADFGNHCIRKIDASGVMRSVAGICGSSGDGGTASVTTAARTFIDRTTSYSRSSRSNGTPSEKESFIDLIDLADSLHSAVKRSGSSYSCPVNEWCCWIDCPAHPSEYVEIFRSLS